MAKTSIKVLAPLPTFIGLNHASLSSLPNSPLIAEVSKYGLLPFASKGRALQLILLSDNSVTFSYQVLIQSPYKIMVVSVSGYDILELGHQISRCYLINRFLMHTSHHCICYQAFIALHTCKWPSIPM